MSGEGRKSQRSFFLIVRKKRIEDHAVAIRPAMGNGNCENEKRELGSTIAVCRADVARPEGSIFGSVAFIACSATSGWVAVERVDPPGCT